MADRAAGDLAGERALADPEAVGRELEGLVAEVQAAVGQ